MRETIGLPCRRMPMHTSKLATSVKDLATSSTNQRRSSLQWRPPWPITQWGLDIMGPFPTAVRQLKFLVVDIDYFTKWVEAETLAIITEKNVQNFVWWNIICRHGIPRVLISYNEKQFDNDTFRDFCSQLGIKNHYSSPTHPPSSQWTGWGHELILVQNHQDSAQGGLQDDSKDTYRRNTISTSIWKRGSHPDWSRTHELQSRKPWWE